MKLVVIEKNKVRINGAFDWLLHMIGYAIAFFIVQSLFKSVIVDKDPIVYFIVVLLLYCLNKTIKPFLVTMTIPITGMTLGLFYPCINLFILKLVDWVMGPHFDLTHIYASFLFAILLSVMNFIADHIIDGMLKKVKAHG